MKNRLEKTTFISGCFGKEFVAYAMLLSFLFAGAHLLGFREHVGILSGTSSLDVSFLFCGAVYMILYIGCVVAVPILLIASVLSEIFHFSE